MFIKNVFLPAMALLANGVAASKVLDLTPKNFDKEVFSGTPALVEFFAPWCGHCKKLAPVYDELAESLAAVQNKIKVAKVDGDAHKDLAQKYEISGFPTIKFFDGTSKEPIDYKAGRALEDFQDYILEKTGARAKRAPKLPSAVEHLTESTFKDAVGKDQGVFVAFTAPWCGHCKTLAPKWERLANIFKPDEATVKIAKVDAEANKALAEAHDIKSYPTIKYFPAGSTTPLKYDGSREEQWLVDYVNEQAGTHRLVGGGLDVKAGTIAALDTIVAKYHATGDGLQALADDAKTAAQGLKDKYAEYYVRVLDKLSQNKGYLEKEKSRLEGLLKKGGLVREKEDDLTSRLNILKKFGFSEETVEEIKAEL